MKSILACMVLLCAPAVAQPAIPDTPMGHTLSDYLAAFNTGDATQIEAFSTAHHFDAKTADQLRAFRGSGGYMLRKIQDSDATSIAAFVQEKNSDFLPLLTIKEVGTPEAPKLSITTQGAQRPPEFIIPRLSQADALNALESKAVEEARHDRFSGLYLVARDGKVLAVRTFGWEDREAKRKITLNTRFRIGSMNKMFTAVATLQLIEAGKLSFDGTVGTYLPDYPNKDVAEKITIRMLLTHTGGTGDFFGPEYDADRLSLKTHADYLARLGHRAPVFTPGSEFSYSNFGFIILGRIIEKVSGEDYYTYVDRHIFKPAGMTHTGSLPQDVHVSHRPVAYTWKDGWVRADTLGYRGTAAGGGDTTAGDLLKFAQALQNEKLLPGRVLANATSRQNREVGYGYGFIADGKGMLQYYGHNGGSQGQNAIFYVYPALGQTVIVLSNFDPPVSDNLGRVYTNRMPATR